MNISPARLAAYPEASSRRSQPSVNFLWGRSFAVKRSNGQIEHGWMLSEEAGYGDAYGEVNAGEVMCVSPDGNTFRACAVKELLQLNKSLSQGDAGGVDGSSRPNLLSQDRNRDDMPPLFQTQHMHSATSNFPAHPGAPMLTSAAASPWPRDSPDGHTRAAGVVLHYTRNASAALLSPKADAGLSSNSFEDLLNLTTIDQNDSPSKSSEDNLAYVTLKSQHSDLLTKYEELSSRHAAALAEMQAMVSTAAVSTSSVLSDMYMDLDKGYDELEQSYKREIQAHQALRTQHRELELELQAANDRFAALQQEHRAHHSKIADLDVRLQSESRFRQQFAEASKQCSELQRQLALSVKTCSATKKELEDARRSIDKLQSDISHQNEVTEDLTQQIRDCNRRNTVLSQQLDKFIQHLENFPDDAFDFPKLPDVVELAHHAYSPSSRVRRQDFAGSPPVSTSDINSALSKLSPTYLSKRFQNNHGAFRSIVVENIQLATSLQLQIEKLKDLMKSLDAERLKNEEITRENADLIRSLEISKESERLAVEESRECQTNCDALIKSIKDKVADAWKVEEQKQLLLEAEVSTLKLEADELASAKELITQFKKHAVEYDEKLARLQNKHETEVEHMKLLHEEECVSLKKQYELDSREATERIEELTQSFESAFSTRIQDEMSNHQARLREERQRFSAQLESSLESLNELREQRAFMMDSMASKVQDVEDLTNKLNVVKTELQKKELEVDSLRLEREALLAKTQADIDSCRQTAEDEAAELRRRFSQQQADDKQALDAGWAALKTLRQEIEESVLASSQIQLEAILSKMRQNFQLEFEKYETQLAESAAQLSAAELKRQNCEAERDSIKQELQQQVQESRELQEKMQQIEESFITLTVKLEAGARTESHLRDVIHQQEEDALMTDTVVRQLENRILHLSKMNAKTELAIQTEEQQSTSQIELKYQTELQQKTLLHEKVLSDCAQQARLIESLKESLETSVHAESRLRNNFQQQQEAAARERTVDQARLLELQLQLKKCKEELLYERAKAVTAGDDAAGHQHMPTQPQQQFCSLAGEMKEALAIEMAAVQATDDPEFVALLNELSKCDHGLKWIREASSYVCAGGSHCVTDEQVMMQYMM